MSWSAKLELRVTPPPFFFKVRCAGRNQITALMAVQTMKMTLADGREKEVRPTLQKPSTRQNMDPEPSTLFLEHRILGKRKKSNQDPKNHMGYIGYIRYIRTRR